MPRESRLMTLKTIQPTTFQITPTDYDVEPVNMSYLQHSSDKIEERQNNLEQQKGVARKAFGEIRQQLYDSPDNNAFIDKKIEEYENRLNSYLLTGDYAGAVRISMDSATKLAEDAELNARLKASQDYKNEVERQRKRVETGDIDQITFDWWQDTQAKWAPDFDKDANGEIIGLKDANFAKKAPVKTLNMEEFSKAMFSLVNPSETSRSSERKWSSTTGDTTGIRDGGGGRRYSTSSKRQVTEQDIRDNMAEAFALGGVRLDSAIQMYDAYEHHVEVLENELAELEKTEGVNSTKYKNKLVEKQRYEDVLSNNQSAASLELFLARLVNNSNYAKTLAYSVTSSGTSREDEDFNIVKGENTLTNPGGGGTGNGNDNTPYPARTGGWLPSFTYTGNNPGAQADNSAQASGNAAIEKLEGEDKKK